ncbi:hypothetical protein [Paracoccus liaowanqingii]|uniref:hypothetical protein n=1 Tax=Paracoccus liaowanqingii TaxID=2560053 RepID=UPI001E460D3E|nr:hypothetical protein [Paracoccus liaowanqingii]
MRWRAPDHHLIDGAALVSTDVFDTLLLRDGVSERARIFAAERRLAEILAARGFSLRPDTLAEARLQAKRQAFRALETGNGRGEVRLADIVARQLTILGLPASQIGALVALRTSLEVAQEKMHLRPNLPLVAFLRRQKTMGRRVVAISDTTLSGVQITALIDHCCGKGLLDSVYSSADEGATKREGTLFTRIATIEGVPTARMLHLGDDRTADDLVPRGLGLRTHYGPRSGLHRRSTRAHGGFAEVGRQVRLARLARGAGPSAAPVTGPEAFGRSVLGPLAAAFALRLWLYMAEAQTSGDTALLFCARGGVGIREVFERLSDRLRLPPIARCDTILVSRLVAARAAIMTRSPAALEEIGREFKGSTFADVAKAIGGEAEPGPGWQGPFDPAHLFDMLDSPSGAPVIAAIARQNHLFHRHLMQVSRGATRIILCDTGLYGSTQRLLAAGFPDVSFETVQFARANYKGHSEEHFSKVSGLMVEQNLYNPLKPQTCILRYWHLIESLFEPAAPSVRLFHETEQGTVAANSGNLSFGAIEPERDNALLAGALAYIDALPDQGAGHAF